MQEGIALFNQGKYFDAHEAWELEWTPIRGPRRFFLQSLIHLAVGFYHHQRHNRDGAIRQLRKGLKKLAAYLPVYDGIDTARLYQEALAIFERIEQNETVDQFPLILHRPHVE
jgi:uncharacterized protein